MASTVEHAEYTVLQELLKRIREAKGLSQRALSGKLGRMSSYIQKIESGERRVDVIEFLHICDALGADESKVLKELRTQIAEPAVGKTSRTAT